MENKILPLLKKAEQKKWRRNKIVGKAKEYIQNKVKKTKEQASKIKTVKEWLMLIPKPSREKVERWLIEYGCTGDDYLDDLIEMESDDIKVLLIIPNIKSDYKYLKAALIGLDTRVKTKVKEVENEIEAEREATMKNIQELKAILS